MEFLDLIKEEARNNRTVMLTAVEADGSVETREVEPYSLRPGDGDQRLYYYCLTKEGIRNTYLHNIQAVSPTGNEFNPRWPIEL